MTAQPKCATCRHWLRPAYREDVRTTVGECQERGVSTSADVGAGCRKHQPAEQQEAA